MSALARKPRGSVRPAPRQGEGRSVEVVEPDVRPEAICFRGQTLALLRHFFELSCQVGRLPSLLGREFFRARVSHHAIPSFEDQVVFARDVELCLRRLNDAHAEIIALVGLYDFTRQEIAGMLRCSRACVIARVNDALDALTEIFLQTGLLSEGRPDRRQWQASGECRRKKPAIARSNGALPPLVRRPITGAALRAPQLQEMPA